MARPGISNLLGALADPSSPEHDDAVERLGEDFDPTRFLGATAGQG